MAGTEYPYIKKKGQRWTVFWKEDDSRSYNTYTAARKALKRGPRRSIDELLDALEAGSYDARPGELVQGSALQVEDISDIVVTYNDSDIRWSRSQDNVTQSVNLDVTTDENLDFLASNTLGLFRIEGETDEQLRERALALLGLPRAMGTGHV